MQATTLNPNVLYLFQKLFSDFKDKTKINADVQQQLAMAIGDMSIQLIFADDDDDDFEFFTDAMQSVMKNVKITRASDGVNLLEILEASGSNLPDLIFLDLNMPCKNGLECLEIIKKSEQWKNIPVLIYSTSAHIDQIEATYKKGANLYIQKPTNYNDIKTVIRKIFAYTIPELALQPIRNKFLFKI